MSFEFEYKLKYSLIRATGFDTDETCYNYKGIMNIRIIFFNILM